MKRSLAVEEMSSFGEKCNSILRRFKSLEQSFFGPVEIEFLGTTKSIPGTIKSLATIANRRLKECNSKTIQGLFWTIAFRVTSAVHLLERWLCIP